jgi:hypothetical protein
MNPIVPSLVAGVKIKGKLRKDIAENQLVQMLTDRIRACFPQGLVTLRNDLSLLLLLARCVKNSGKKYKFDLSEIVCKCYVVLFPGTSVQELEVIDQHLSVLIDNGLVKRLTLLQRTYHSLFSNQKNE